MPAPPLQRQWSPGSASARQRIGTHERVHADAIDGTDLTAVMAPGEP